MEKVIGGIKRECYPLSEAQMLHLYTMTLSPTHEIVNMGTGRYLQTKLDLAALREALNRAVERCETMRLRLWRDPETGQVWQYIAPYEHQHFEYYDFSGWREDKVREVLDGWTAQPFDTFGGPLSRIVIVNELKEIIKNYVEVEDEVITEDARFSEDLGFNSYDFMCMLGDIEDELDIELDEEEAASSRTVAQLIEYLEGQK